MTGPRNAVRHDAMEAVRHITHDRALSKLFFLLIVAGLSINPLFMVTMQAFVKEELGRNSGDTAIPLMLTGFGIATSSIVVMRKGDMKNKGAAFMRAMMMGCLFVTLMGRTTSLAQLAVVSLFMGFAGGFFINMNQGLIQANTPARLLGRVMSLFTFVQAALTPLGGLLLGLLASQIGVGNTMSVVAPCGFLCVAIVYFTDSELRHMS